MTDQTHEKPVSGGRRSLMLLHCVVVTVFLISSVLGCTRSQIAEADLDDSEKAATREVQGIAVGAAEILNVYMDARVTDVRALTIACERLKLALTTPEKRADTSRVLDEWMKMSGAYDAVLLLDKSGVCVAASSEGLLNQGFSGDACFKDAVSGKLAIVDGHRSDAVAFVDPKSNGWTLSIAAPVVIGDEVAGVLMSYLKWSRLEALMSSLRVGDTGNVLVLNSQNQIIVHPRKEYYGIGLREPRIDSPELDDAIKHKASYKRYKFRILATGTDMSGTRTVIDRTGTGLVGFAYPRGYGNFPGLGWTVGARVDEAEIVGGNFFCSLFR